VRIRGGLLDQSSVIIRSTLHPWGYTLSTADPDTRRLIDLNTAWVEINKQIKGLTPKQKQRVLTLALAIHFAGVRSPRLACADGVLKGGVATQRRLGNHAVSGSRRRPFR
jgi:hypothetical protein